MIKMYCIFAMESIKKMNGSRGKLASMSGHAYLHAYWDSGRRACGFGHGFGEDVVPHTQLYKQAERAFKITLVVDTVEELRAIEEEYREICGVSLVTDAGFTVFDEPTTVCLVIGPIPNELVTDTIKKLKVLT